jgi:hypothetical protein
MDDPFAGQPGSFERALLFQQRVQWYGELFPSMALRAGWDARMLYYHLCPCCGYPKLFIGNPEANCFFCRLGVEEKLASYVSLKDAIRPVWESYDALVREKDFKKLKELWTAVRQKHGELEKLVPEDHRTFL